MYDNNRRTGGGKPYDCTQEEWDTMSVEEKQRFFDVFRTRVYAFWMAEAEYQDRRDTRVSSHRVDKTLK